MTVLYLASSSSGAIEKSQSPVSAVERSSAYQAGEDFCPAPLADKILRTRLLCGPRILTSQDVRIVDRFSPARRARRRHGQRLLFPGPADSFVDRHIGPSAEETAKMLDGLGFASLDSFIAQVVPPQIRLARPLRLPEGRSEQAVLAELRAIAGQNQVFRSFIGMGYSDCFTPPVIQRNILENPGWYTPYTPYQAEISQGRLEALFNFQTLISDLTGLPIANASLLDEATAAAEAMHLCHNVKPERAAFFVSQSCHPQTIEVVRTRARPLGIEIVVGDHQTFQFSDKVFGALVQYPATDGDDFRLREFCPPGARRRGACWWWRPICWR